MNDSTNAQDPVYAFKGQARRLADALRELKLSVTHSQALDLIGRVHGHRDWKELSGLTASRSAKAAVAEASETEQLTYFEYWLRIRDVSEEDLDMLVHDWAASHQASAINNSGLYAQLEFLLHNACGGSFEALRRLVAEDSEISGTLDWQLPGVWAKAWDADQEQIAFDALPWLLAQGDAETLRRLFKDSKDGGVGNCDLGDEVAAWTLKHGSPEDRAQLKRLYARISAIQAARPDAIGITVDIPKSAVSKFIAARFAGPELSALQAALMKR